ncbi:MAG TPA: DUF5667 domain-containing protein [Actinopolymorphaceae bacterium]|nr:DUF5667 domain-containing protein [Actinopolymorphaceae bacterium]
MTSLLATRRRAEDFARLVEGSRRSHDPNVAPLLDLVAMLRPAGVQPSEVFRTSLRERLLTVAAELPRSAVPDASPIPAIRSSFRTPTRVRIVAVALAVALAGGMVGTAAAARNALPGELLYPIKRGLEHSEAAATTNADSRGREYLGQATSRLGEVSDLAAGGPVGAGDLQRVALSQATLGDFAVDVREAGDQLVEAAHLSGQTAPLIQLREFVAETRPRLQAVKALLPAQVDDAYDNALTALERLDQRVVEICPLCAAGSASGAISGNAGTGQSSRGGGDTRRSGASQPSRGKRTTGPVDAGTSQPGTTAPLIRLTLPLGPLGSTAGAGAEPEQTGAPAQRQTAGPPTGTLSIPLPNPTSLPLPLPSKLPLPTSLPLPLGAAAKPQQATAMSLPWLLPYGGAEPDGVAVLPPGLLPTLAPLPSQGQASPGKGAKQAPAPGATKGPTPSPSPTVLPFPGGDDGASPSPSPTSGGSIFDKLFGPLLPF